MASARHTSSTGTGRLLVALIVFGVGLLAVVPHETTLMWQASVLVTEWGHWLGLASLLLLLGRGRSWPHGAAALLTLLGAVMLLSPAARAMLVSPSVAGALDQTFGSAGRLTSTDAPGRPAPLVLADLLLGASAGDVLLDEHVYDVVDGENLTLDLYRPQYGTDPRPVVIVIHGGGWTDGDKRDLTKLSRYLAARGYVVANIAYRLAPRWRFPAPQEDVQSAIDYVKDLEATHGVDPTRVALLGRSVGGQIALLAGYATEDPSIRAVVSLYGPAALRWGYGNPAKPGVIDSSEVLEIYLGGSPATHGEIYDAAEPTSFIDETAPPTLFIQGLRDEHVSPFHAEFVSARLFEVGVPHLVVKMPWATHGCDYVFSGPCGQISTYAIERFLGAVLRGSPIP